MALIKTSIYISCTPTDASHVLGLNDIWYSSASEKALLLFGRRRTGAGNRLSTDSIEMANMIVKQLTHQTDLALLETAFTEEANSF